MSRLYLKHQTDLSHKGHRAHEELSASVFWGSTYDSKLAARITVKWVKGKEEPIVWVEKGEGVKAE